MKTSLKWRQGEAGQTAVLFVLMLVGLLAFVGLAIDGGHVLRERRVTQNGADASALGGLQYIAVADSPNETDLLKRINRVVEDNGVPDTNGVPGDEVNENVVAYYTDDRGNHLVAPNCNVVGTCSGVPHAAAGIDVDVTNPVNTYLLGIIGQDNLDIGASAIAVMRGFVSDALASNVMIALGHCPTYDRQMTGRGGNNEFLGGLYSNSWFDSTGNNNHFHGPITYVEGYPGDTGNGNVFDSAPTEGDPLANPFEGWSYMDFAPTSTVAIANAGFYYDVSVLDRPSGGNPGIVEMSEIINRTMDPTMPELYNPDNKNPMTTSDGIVLQPNQMRSGIYWAGDKEINIGETAGGGQAPLGTNGTVTIVSGNKIKTTEKAMNLSAYLGQGSAFPGLLFFSDMAPANPCVFDEQNDVIRMAGNAGLKPEVYHHPDDIPNGANPDDYIGCPYPKIDGCYVPSNQIFTGLIYAPYGDVRAADSATTYIGAIVAYTIDYSGSDNLFVQNPALFPTDNPTIQLER